MNFSFQRHLEPLRQGIYDEFLAKLTKIAQGMTIGDPFDPSTMHGPQISETHYNVGGDLLIHLATCIAN
jgi:acyl-CoA reductase-like NAD-dependent aldehyde dehydrogenase